MSGDGSPDQAFSEIIANGMQCGLRTFSGIFSLEQQGLCILTERKV